TTAINGAWTRSRRPGPGRTRPATTGSSWPSLTPASTSPIPTWPPTSGPTPARRGSMRMEMKRPPTGSTTTATDTSTTSTAGNSNSDVPTYPAAYPGVLAVSATDELDQRWVDSPTVGSSYGPHIFCSAPGHQILSTFGYSVYYMASGTSAAAPYVAGLAAL